MSGEVATPDAWRWANMGGRSTLESSAGLLKSLNGFTEGSFEPSWANFDFRRRAKRRNTGLATLAQLVERLIRNQQVAGSIPAGGSRFFKQLTSFLQKSWIQLDSIRRLS